MRPQGWWWVVGGDRPADAVWARLVEAGVDQLQELARVQGCGLIGCVAHRSHPLDQGACAGAAGGAHRDPAEFAVGAR